MSTLTVEPLLRFSGREKSLPIGSRKILKPSSLNFSKKLLLSNGSSFCNFKRSPPLSHTVRASSTTDTALIETFKSADVLFKETFSLSRTETIEGKIFVRLDKEEKDQQRWQLSVGCSLPGKWILHWGVSYVGDVGSEWDQPPKNMRPRGSISIKDYAIETPLEKSSEADMFYEVKIDLDPNSSIAAINFVLKDEETGAWYQHKGRDFKVPLVDYLLEGGNVVGAKRGFSIWPGSLLSNMLLKTETLPSKDEDNNSETKDVKQDSGQLKGFYEEQPITKQVTIQNSATVSVTKCPKTAKYLLYLETDLPGEVVLHWGVCRDDAKNWEIPSSPHPPETTVFKNKALQTMLQPNDGGNGCSGLFSLDEEFAGFLFVLKLNEGTWLKCKGNDFYVPLSTSSSLPTQPGQGQSEGVLASGKDAEGNEEVSRTAYTDEIIDEIRNLVNGISSEKVRQTKTKEAQESILQEIEKLAAEAYSIFRSSIPTFTEESVLESEVEKAPPAKICSGTGTGHEILLQGFNWESNKSGRWHMELKEKAAEISSLGFTVIWLPPPTESVSPEGYMPKDLYNLNSRYGSIDELKDLVKSLHRVGLKVLGDAVLNHRCAHFQNQNGVWNIFGGRLNWDDRAIVADDPHFQGRGSKSSGDNFHAAPNIDHSQDFVRQDLKEWLCWLRDEIGYNGWRLDFVRGFWGGYVKDYMEATEPYFAVGEYWDSLSYTYGEMDHNQDAHRQRIIDWINATNGTAGAFDVTTKGILHSALDRCEYWRLSDQKGKPPGVVGWWPSRAVTFIENHDTGSTQGHWRFPNGKEMQGYAYILTHPGTPTVFYDHIFSHYRSEIASLISLRKRNEIHCRSSVKITKAERDVYAAIIEEKVAMKIGPGHYEPPSGKNWSMAIEGKDYKVWEAS
ncbi:alpha-amylase 3, chloroplastic [Ricinus communis]|uniref:alpha-amylase n=1 Tax=Ricinus communis TaxID=3988 RepID=B9S2B5_RICCO|nr:alpha-amylase 3, chloroplastic [Ricinus communis]EEF42189.1 alpha-amylase, putative [Ricinus communis]|eukprot:XP_002520134.1 alpha-amylase 3, chloroplastic [Ricinus communis]